MKSHEKPTEKCHWMNQGFFTKCICQSPRCGLRSHLRSFVITSPDGWRLWSPLVLIHSSPHLSWKMIPMSVGKFPPSATTLRTLLKICWYYWCYQVNQAFPDTVLTHQDIHGTTSMWIRPTQGTPESTGRSAYLFGLVAKNMCIYTYIYILYII